MYLEEEVEGQEQHSYLPWACLLIQRECAPHSSQLREVRWYPQQQLLGFTTWDMRNADQQWTYEAA